LAIIEDVELNERFSTIKHRPRPRVGSPIAALEPLANSC
jgi:hypothetical protein